MPCRRTITVGVLAAALSAAAAPAHAQQLLSTVDLRFAPKIPLTIATPSSSAGDSVAIGDFDGDGSPDVAIGAHNASPNGRKDSGAVEIRFGPLTKNSTRHLVIQGAHAGDEAGYSLANAGDVNGDGADDLLIGAYEASPNGRTAAGSAYLVYGRDPGPAVDLASAGDSVLRIDGAAPRDNLGFSVADAGDQDGDGVPDLLIGSPGADPFGRDRAGSAFLVHGAGTPGVVDLAKAGPGVTQFAGTENSAVAGWSVAGSRDFDGDGRPDLAIGSPEQGTIGSDTGPGAVFVVHGPANAGGVVDLAQPSPQILTIHGPIRGDLAGWSVAMVGDMNADRKSDLAIGSWNLAPLKREQGGGVFVVYGTTTTGTVVPAQGGKRGFEIDGRDVSARAGRSVAPAGDMDGDGVPDFLIGSGGLSVGGHDFAGGADLVFGGPRDSPLDLSEIDRGWNIDGVHTDDRTGDDLAAGGDLDGDGRPDAVIGAPHLGDDHRGGAYLVTDPAPVVMRATIDKGAGCAKPRVMLGINARAAVRMITKTTSGARMSRKVRWYGPDKHAVAVPRPAGGSGTLKVHIAATGSDGNEVIRDLKVKPCAR